MSFDASTAPMQTANARTAAESPPKHTRLIEVRSQRYESASDAARAIGVPVATYVSHENGHRGLGRSAQRYAKFFRVSLNWLVLGKGTRSGAPAVPLTGFVGAGAVVSTQKNGGIIERMPWVELPNPNATEALIVQGDSMYPRFMPGEVILYETVPLLPAKLVDQYAIVDIEDGGLKIKILRDGGRPGFWTLESHNAPPEHNVALNYAYRWVGLLSPSFDENGEETLPRKLPPRTRSNT